jgi:amidohydrolase
MGAKESAQQQIENNRDALIALSHRIHANPELGFEEVKASAWLAEILSDGGFSVETGVCDLPTAFIAKAGSGPLHIGICAEYDALPGVGHACGHNIIAAMAVGAGLAAAAIADEVGLTVSVIGTPAEEGGGGKVFMLERGAFEGIHAAMMVHPAPFDVVAPKMLASSRFEVRYTGKEAHASAFPEQGINAADALTIAQTSIGLLRQHILPTQRIHGIVTKGGDAPNIIPAHTSAEYILRGQTRQELEDLRPRVVRCFEAGALATGSSLEILEVSKPYTEVAHDQDMSDIYRRNSEALGRTYPDLGPLAERAAASTDMGNVSLELPSIHPMIGINSAPAGNHQPEFTAHCATEDADRAIIDGATAMAWTAIDMATEEGVRQRLLSRD